MNDRELTLTDLLADPMILAVMAAIRSMRPRWKRPCLDWPVGLSSPGAAGAVAAPLSPAHERKRFSRILCAPSMSAIDRMATKRVGNNDWRK